MPNKDNVEIEKILPALAAIGGAVGRAAMAGGRAMAAGKRRGGGGEDESGGLDEQDAHAQTEWENIHRSTSMQKLMKFVQIQKIGYPDEVRYESERKYPKGFKRDESSGIPSHGSKEWDALNELWDKLLVQGVVRKEFPLDLAHRYLRAIQLDEEGNQISIMNHIAGHQALADVHNLMNFGERFDLHPDRLEYQFPDTSRPVTGEDGWTTLGDSFEKPPKGYMAMLDAPRNQGWNTPRSLEDFQRHILPAIINPAIEDEQSNQALGIMDDLHRRVRQTSPNYDPGDATFPKLQSPRGEFQFGPRSSYGTETAPLPGSQQARNRENDLAIYEQTGKWPPGADSSAGSMQIKEPYDRDVHSVTGHRTEPPWKTEDKSAYRYPKRGENAGIPDGPNYLLGEGDTLPNEHRTDYFSPQDRRNFRFPTESGTFSEPQYYKDKAQPSAPKSKAQNAFEQWRPDLFRDKEKAVSKLMKFIKAEEDDGIEGFRRHLGDEIQRQVDKNRPHTEWEDTHPDLFLPVGHDNAPLFLEPEEKGGKRVPSVHYHAYNYLDKIHRDVPMTANQHADGLKKVHRSDMLQRHGAAVRDMDYDDAFPLGRARPNRPPRNAPKGQRPSQEYLDTTRKEMNIHDFLTDHTESMLSKVPSQHKEGIQRMFNKVAFESPSYKPTGSFETDPDIQRYFSVSKLENSLQKEGAVGGEGGGFDGLSGTVFTSTNAGIFTPTFGGKGTKRKHRKNKKRQEKKRKKLMGKEKKSGVERLVQYLYEGSPHISKAGKRGLAPGLDADMTGNAPTAHAGNNRTHSPFVPVENSSDLNHKRTSRELEDAMKVAESNEPHINMGLAGNMEAAIAASSPQREGEDPSVMNAKNPRKAEWHNNAYVQKAANEATTFIAPDGGNESADGPHPQKAFVERTKNNPNESPHKDAVTKENDMQRRVKKYDNKEEEGNEPYQPEGAMATPGMGGYPSGAAMQMSSFGFNTYEQDSLARGGEEDKEKEGRDNERMDEGGTVWIPEDPNKTKATLESMRKALEDAGDETPLLTALYKLDYS